MRKAIYILVILSVLLVSGCVGQGGTSSNGNDSTSATPNDQNSASVIPNNQNPGENEIQNTNPVYFSLEYYHPIAIVNEPYSDSYSSQYDPSGGNPPYHFQLDSGTGFPPMGLTLNPDGTITGTPTAVGNVSFRVCAVDQSGTQACDNTYIDVRDVYATFDSISCTQTMGDNGVVAGYLITASGTAKGDKYMSLQYTDDVFDQESSDNGIGYVSTQEQGSTCGGWDDSAMARCNNNVGDASSISWTFIFRTFLNTGASRTLNAKVAMYNGNQHTKFVEKQFTCP